MIKQTNNMTSSLDDEKHLPLKILPYLTNPSPSYRCSCPCPRPSSSSLLAHSPPAATRRRKGGRHNRGTRAETEDGSVLVLVMPFLVD